MSEFLNRLKKLGGNWKKASKRDPKEFGGSAVEDGIYRLRITGCELTESMSSGRLQIHWEFTVAEGEQKGEQCHDYDGLESEDNLFFLQRKLARLGKEVPEDISEIETVLAEIIKERPLIRGRVKTKDDFTHVYINRMLDDKGADVEFAEPDGGEPDPEEAAPEAEPEAEPAAEPEEVQPEAEAEPEPAPEAEPEGVSLEEGMRVSFQSKGATVEGELLEFVDNDSKARVKTDAGVYKVAVESLSPVEGETEPEPEPAPEPAKRGPGRPAKAATAPAKPATAPAKAPAKPAPAKTTGKVSKVKK